MTGAVTAFPRSPAQAEATRSFHAPVPARIFLLKSRPAIAYPLLGAADDLLYQTLTNTNSWRAPGDERGAPGRRTFFATERTASQ